MIVVAVIGAQALWLLFVWLLSAAIGSWVSDRKGYGERVGLAFGLILSAIGLLIVLCCCPGAQARSGRARAGDRAGAAVGSSAGTNRRAVRR